MTVFGDTGGKGVGGLKELFTKKVSEFVFTLLPIASARRSCCDVRLAFTHRASSDPPAS
jgi:hypothetical protein